MIELAVACRPAARHTSRIAPPAANRARRGYLKNGSKPLKLTDNVTSAGPNGRDSIREPACFGQSCFPLADAVWRSDSLQSEYSTNSGREERQCHGWKRYQVGAGPFMLCLRDWLPVSRVLFRELDLKSGYPAAAW